MKLIIASDLHGNYFYTYKLFELANKINPDNIILLGDLLHNRSWTDEFDTMKTANLLNKYSSKIINVRGNCDNDEYNELLLFNNESKYKEIDLDGKKYVLIHGDIMYPFIDKDDIIIAGHTHESVLSSKYINPGSVGKPMSNYYHSCLIYEENTFKLINLDDFSIIDSLKV